MGENAGANYLRHFNADAAVNVSYILLAGTALVGGVQPADPSLLTR